MELILTHYCTASFVTSFCFLMGSQERLLNDYCLVDMLAIGDAHVRVTDASRLKIKA